MRPPKPGMVDELARTPIVAVSGLGRCGTTMVMAMLYAGGIPCTEGPPAFEDTRVLGLPRSRLWLKAARGHAIKFLDPARYRPPEGPSYRVVWMSRDPEQQARSTRKFIHHLDEDARPRALPRIKADVVLGSARGLRVWRSMRFVEVLELSFERVVADPLESAFELGKFLARPFDAKRAAAAVVSRPLDCLAVVHDVEVADMSAAQVAEHDERHP